MKKILITGANGQVGTEYQLSPPLPDWDYYFLSKEELDITNSRRVQRVFRDIEPDAVLNLAAFTDVEKAETEYASLAYEINVNGPKNLAIACEKHEIPLIHISTDYVFDGTKTDLYTEKDEENPINMYGKTKFLGEEILRENCSWYYILRTSWVYSNHTKNFFTTMLSLAQERGTLNVVNDQYGSPTSAKEVCNAVDTILKDLDRDKSGVYHYSGLGKTTWKDFAIEIFNQTRVAVTVNAVSSSSWPSKVNRPMNSYMSSGKFYAEFGRFPIHWKNALREVVSERKILPIKVGDVVVIQDEPRIIVSTDWLKKIARISKPDDLSNSIEISFNELSVK